MLDKVKLALRYRNNFFDDEIQTLIDSCIRELKNSGIKEEKLTDEDASVVACVVAYCKYQLNHQGQWQQWKTVYENCRLSIVLDHNYH